MPVEADATDLHTYKMPKKGVNLYVEKSEINEEEAVKTTNMFWRDGMQKRKGYAKFETDQVQSSKKETTGLVKKDKHPFRGRLKGNYAKDKQPPPQRGG